MKKSILLLLLPLLCSVSGCSNPMKKYFKSWNSDSKVIKTLINYVEEVTNPKNKDSFIPVNDRIATFDMDGTFVGELYPTYFEYNLLEYRALYDESYVDKDPNVVAAGETIQAFAKNNTPFPTGFDLIHAHAAAKAYEGMTIKEFHDFVKLFASKPANGFNGMTYGESFYKPMLEVFEYLKDNDFSYYVVSGSDRFICRALVESINIEPDHVIGMDVKLKTNKQGDEEEGVHYEMGKDEYLVRTDELLIKNLETNKVKQIMTDIGKVPVLSFGNSGGDTSMHNFTMSNSKYKSQAYMLIADNDELDHAKKRGETDEQYQERIDGLYAKWTANEYNIISMKDDFKTIYGEGVQKIDFRA